MKRFQFGLAKLLSVKEQREKIAESRVAQARKEADSCREQLSRLQQALAAHADRMAESVGIALPVGTWAGTFDHSSRLERAIRDAETAVRRAEKILKNAIEARMRIATEVEALETLREQHLDLYKLDVQRKEQEQLDEVVMRQWQRSKDKG